MKTKILHTVLFSLLFAGGIFAQDVTTVRANNSDISDNLDLQAVASIFGDSQDLEDFERRLNDPNTQISNLDLNGDNKVDYLRVIEVTEKNTHVVILQSVLAVDTYQDVATIEVERDRNNNVTVQVVGDSYIYGNNYIYEPVYVSQPAMFNVFWASSYRPYYSPWYYGYYPTYYSYWTPYAPYRYRHRVHNHINYNNNYRYVDVRRSTRAQSLYGTRSSNAYAEQNPTRSFANRNANVSNRHQLEQTRNTATGGTRGRNVNSNGTARVSVRNASGNADSSVRNTGVRNTLTPSRTQGTGLVKSNGRTVNNESTAVTPARTTAPRTTSSVNSVRESTPAPAVRYNNQSRNVTPSRSAAPAQQSVPSVRNTPAPAMRSNPAPAMRSNPAPTRSMQQAPAPQRQAAPAASRGGSGRRG